MLFYKTKMPQEILSKKKKNCLIIFCLVDLSLKMSPSLYIVCVAEVHKLVMH